MARPVCGGTGGARLGGGSLSFYPIDRLYAAQSQILHGMVYILQLNMILNHDCINTDFVNPQCICVIVSGHLSVQKKES